MTRIKLLAFLLVLSFSCINVFASTQVYVRNFEGELQALPFSAEKPDLLMEKDLDFLETDFLPLLNTVPMRESGPVGIVDRGGSCYADTVIQMLFRIPVIRKIIANLHIYHSRAKLLDSQIDFDDFKILEGLNHIFYQLQTNVIESATYDFSLSMQALPGVHAENGPGDAGEYFNLILSVLKDITPRSQHHHFIINITIKHSNSDWHHADINTIISLPIHQGPCHLTGLLDEYFAPETVQLSLKTSIVTTKKLQNLPEFIAIHLQRASADFNSLKKNNNPVFVPEELDFTPYTESIESQSPKYRLIMFIVHTGELISNGHFISHYRSNCASVWSTFDDNCVTFDEDRIQTDLENGYIIFYERINLT
jgi:ubiquitin C-terminal hydrolase